MHHRSADHEPRRDYLLHTVGIAKVQIAFNAACALQGIPKPTWIHERQTYPDLATRMQKAKLEKRPLPATERFILYDRFPVAIDRTAVCWPDASNLTLIPSQEAGTHPLIIYWEYDRGTERLAQVAAKMYGYDSLLRTAAYRRHWPSANGEPTVRIFFVIEGSKTRLQNIAETLKNFPAAAAVRLTTTADLQPAKMLTDPIWYDTAGNRKSILRIPIAHH